MKRLMVLFGMASVLNFADARATVWQVNVADFQFTPADLTIVQGDTVVWTNTAGFHNVRHDCDPSLFGNSPASNPWSYQFAFHVPIGHYEYICDVHPENMIGSITVERRGKWNVAVGSFFFQPQHIFITPGDTVVWTNTGGLHNVHHNATPSLFGNSPSSSLWVYSFIFNLAPGAYPYVCEVHPSLMSGGVNILDTPAPFSPENLVVERQSDLVVLNWEGKCSGATGYNVYRSESADMEGALLIGQTPAAVTTFSDPLDGAADARHFCEVRGRK